MPSVAKRLEDIEEDPDGAFGGFEIDGRSPGFGCKVYPVSAVQDEEGTLSHAYRERIILEYLSANETISKYVARMDSATYDMRRECLKLRLERVHGSSLLYLLQQPWFEAEHAMQITCKLIEAFAILHELGVSHGDIKSDNVMIRKDDLAPKLIDWGCARWGVDVENVTRVCGNLPSSSPQIVENWAVQSGLTRRSKLKTYNSIKNDVFAVGHLLAFIWTSIGTNGTAPCSAFGSDWDAVADEDLDPSALVEFQEYVLEEFEGQAHFRKIPKLMQIFIVNCIQRSERKRAKLIDLWRDLYDSDAKMTKGGVSLRFRDYLRPPPEDKIEPLKIKQSPKLPTARRLLALWPRERVVLPREESKLTVSTPTKQAGSPDDQSRPILTRPRIAKSKKKEVIKRHASKDVAKKGKKAKL